MATLDPTHLIRVMTRAKELLVEYGLDGWRFEISNTKRIMGQCMYDQKKITFSKWFLNQPWHEIEDTLRHEVAHALAGSAAGHGRVWKMMAIRVGARPKACSETARSSAKPNYAYGCQTCGWKVYRYRLRRELRHHYCAKCGGELTFYRVRKEGDE